MPLFTAGVLSHCFPCLQWSNMLFLTSISGISPVAHRSDAGLGDSLELFWRLAAESKPCHLRASSVNSTGMCAFSLLNLQTLGWPPWWLNSSCSEPIMTCVILPLVLQGLFAVLIKEADWWLGTKPGCVAILYACDTVQFQMCMCVFRQAWRTAEVEHWSLKPIGVSKHATDSVTLTSVMTLGLIPEECSRGKRWENVAKGVIQLGWGSTTRCKSYSSMLLGAICF